MVIHNIDIRDKGKIIRFQVAISVVDDDDLIVTTDHVGLLGRLTCHGRNRIARITLKEETLLDFFCDVLLSLGFIVLNIGFIQIVVDLELGAGKCLSEDAAHAPNVEGALVVLLRQDDFGGSVPSGHNSGRKASRSSFLALLIVVFQFIGHSTSVDIFLLLSHIVEFSLRFRRFVLVFVLELLLDLENVIFLLESGRFTSCEAKIAEPNATVTIDKQISWFEVAMHQIS